MKFVYCTKCNDIFVAINKIARTCLCGKHSAKYLNDNITAVATKGCVIFGLDNVTLKDAVIRADAHKQHDYRRDFFFTGWVPNHAGEVVFVDSVSDVKEYPYDEPQALPEGLCTNPDTAEKHSMKNIMRRIKYEIHNLRVKYLTRKAKEILIK
jgi:hypothetical protein